MSRGKGRVSRSTLLATGGDGAEVGEDEVGVGAGDLGVIGVGEGGIEVGAAFSDSFVHGAVELVGIPGADAGFEVWGEVGAGDGAEGGFDAASTGEGGHVGGGVAGDAVAGGGEGATSLGGEPGVLVGLRRVGERQEEQGGDEGAHQAETRGPGFGRYWDLMASRVQ